MKYLIGVLALTAAVVAGAPAYAQTGATGEWELSMSTPQGNSTVNLSLNVAGDKITGELSSPMGAVPVNGTATGDDVKLTADINIQGMALTFAIDGKVSGDAMEGAVKVGDFGEFPFTGKRAAAKAVATAATVTNGAAAAPITDLNGKWDIKIAIPGAGDFPATAEMKQEGEKVSGTINSMAGSVALAGTVTGKTVKFEFEAETPQGKLPVTMTGDIGTTSVTGKAAIAGMGEADWTATRAVQ